MVPWAFTVADFVDRNQTLRFTSDPCNAAALREQVRGFLEEAGLEGPDVESLVLAANEAFANIVEHAYDGRHDGAVDLELIESHESVEIGLRDYGEKPDPRTLKSRDLDEVRPGGLGIHFMQSAADEVSWDTSYERGTRVCIRRHKKGTKA